MIIYNKKTDQTHIALGFKGFSRFHPEYVVQEIIGVLMGGGMSSRLFTEVREKRGLAYRINTGVSSYKEIGDFGTYAGISNNKVVPALEIILSEHKRLTNEAVEEKELIKIKDYIKGKTAIGLEASDAQASYYADQELLENKIETIEARLKKLDAVTAEDIQRVSKIIFTPENLNVALIGPFESEDENIKKAVESFK